MSFNRMDWTPYLESIHCDSRYALTRECFTPLDVLDRRPETRSGTPLLLDLRVRTVPEAKSETKERQEQLDCCLAGMTKHGGSNIQIAGLPKKLWQ